MLTAHRLRYLLSYSKASGILKWRNPASHRTSIGSVAGSINADGYCIIQLARKKYLAHRIAVMLATGHPPKRNIKHRNGQRADNRWRNLRVA